MNFLGSFSLYKLLIPFLVIFCATLYQLWNSHSFYTLSLSLLFRCTLKSLQKRNPLVYRKLLRRQRHWCRWAACLKHLLKVNHAHTTPAFVWSLCPYLVNMEVNEACLCVSVFGIFTDVVKISTIQTLYFPFPLSLSFPFLLPSRYNSLICRRREVGFC